MDVKTEGRGVVWVGGLNGKERSYIVVASWSWPGPERVSEVTLIVYTAIKSPLHFSPWLPSPFSVFTTSPVTSL